MPPDEILQINSDITELHHFDFKKIIPSLPMIKKITRFADNTNDNSAAKLDVINLSPCTYATPALLRGIYDEKNNLFYFPLIRIDTKISVSKDDKLNNYFAYFQYALYRFASLYHPFISVP